MARPVLPRPHDGPQLPESVLRRRPAVVVPTQRAPATAVWKEPRRRPLPATPKVRGRRTFPLPLVAAGLVFLGLFAVAAGLGAATDVDLSGWFHGPDKPPPRAFPVLDPSPPVRLTIASIKVDAPIMDVGLAKDGSVDVPPLDKHNEAGWFDQGPTPGQFGPAIIVGHIDTRQGPSVFYNLGKVKSGDKIEVERRDHQVAVFEVNSVEHYGKGELPVGKVYGDYSRPGLRLVTCGGNWLGGAQGYSDNIVVFASLVKAEDA